MIAETNNGTFLAAETSSFAADAGKGPSVAEDIGQEAAYLLLEEIYRVRTSVGEKYSLSNWPLPTDYIYCLNGLHRFAPNDSKVCQTFLSARIHNIVRRYMYIIIIIINIFNRDLVPRNNYINEYTHNERNIDI